MATEDVTNNGMETTSSTAPKKRRRRAAATGASEDCFTCRKRHTRCDRKRPYCSQCLEFGKDCSGYKTTLTWGVGVASRGKLRGLSCPVAKETEDGATEPKKTVPAQRRKSSTSKVSKTSKTAKEALFKSTYETEFPATSPDATFPNATSPTTRDPSNLKTEVDSELSHAYSLPISIQRSHWDYTASLPSSSSHPSIHGSVSSTSVASENQPLDPALFPLHAGPMSTFDDVEYPMPSPTNLSYGEGFSQILNNTYNEAQGLESEQQPASSFFEESDHTRGIAFAHRQYLQQDADKMSQYSTEFQAMNELEVSVDDLQSQQVFDGSSSFDLSIPRALFYSQFFHLPSRMQYLLDYYNKFVCSVLVAFDSSINPYRQHILELATHNEGLQNAIAALAINNMRMRNQDQAGSIGFIEDISDQNAHITSVKALKHSKPSPEEAWYKTVSINQLQMQLANPHLAHDDSVLATLLILCLFHTCDSGFSKFKTQLEGVQKLLSMRDFGVRTGFIGWIEMFFTWFDVMTSTVNDRETEIRGDRLDMMQYSSNLGALEQFSGCDGRLFKLIARLGRLNLLSQNRPVRAERDSARTPRPSQTSRQTRAFGVPSGPGRWQKRMVVDPRDYTKLDGNGWGMPIVSTPDDLDNMATDDRAQPTDARHEFWSEWTDIRAHLQSWTMNDSVSEEDMATMPMGPEQRDMIHINESFRSSALLYTERLAYPHLPSSAQNFQVFVRNALSHIMALPVTSCVNKFLLWPLFIAGTECVDMIDRANVRERCLEVQRESGFYNNISVLEVLERVWAEQGEDEQGGDVEEVRRRERDSMGSQGGFGQAFRWRKAMNRVDGEYIVV